MEFRKEKSIHKRFNKGRFHVREVSRKKKFPRKKSLEKEINAKVRTIIYGFSVYTKDRINCN